MFCNTMLTGQIGAIDHRRPRQHLRDLQLQQCPRAPARAHVGLGSLELAIDIYRCTSAARGSRSSRRGRKFGLLKRWTVQRSETNENDRERTSPDQGTRSQHRAKCPSCSCNCACSALKSAHAAAKWRTCAAAASCPLPRTSAATASALPSTAPSEPCSRESTPA